MSVFSPVCKKVLMLICCGQELHRGAKIKTVSFPELLHHLSVSFFTCMLKFPTRICFQSSALLSEAVSTCVKCLSLSLLIMMGVTGTDHGPMRQRL